MSEAAARVTSWRKAKREAGYRAVMLWLPIEAKAELDALAYARKQDIATCVVEAVRALATSQGVRRPLKLDAHQYSRLREELAADLQRRFCGTAEADTPPAAPTPPVPPPRRRAKTGGKQGLAPEVLAAIIAEREKHPNMSYANFGQHLYDTGVYKATSRTTGELVPVQAGSVKVWLNKAGHQ